jgi:hypothetical protein
MYPGLLRAFRVVHMGTAIRSTLCRRDTVNIVPFPEPAARLPTTCSASLPDRSLAFVIRIFGASLHTRLNRIGDEVFQVRTTVVVNWTQGT